MLYAAILLLFFLLKKISGSIIVAFLTCMFCSIHAEILRYATIMMSEMLFLFCSVAAIFLMLSIKPEQLFTKKGVRDTVLLVLLLFLVNYIYFVRTMGTSLILAIIIYSGILFFKRCYALYKNRKNLEESPFRKTFFQQLLRYGLLFVLLDRFVLGYENGLGRTEQKRRQNKQRLHQRLYEKTEWTNDGQLGRLEKPDYR